jgi:hypothetical protein
MPLATSNTGCRSLWRFFQISQFKRSCGKHSQVGSGGSLSPRGDYRAPSDSEATVWLEQLKRIPDLDPVAPPVATPSPAVASRLS